MGSLSLLLRYAMRVHSRFRLPAEEVITGRFMGDLVLANVTGTRNARFGNDGVNMQQQAGLSSEQAALADSQQ